MGRSEALIAQRPPGPTVRVHTLGRFAIEIDGAAVPLGMRARRKPLALLKLLIALGGSDVPTHRMADVLWPDSEGDAAQRTFNTTLHRLRGLIGRPAMYLEHGRLSLEPRVCQVDALVLAERWRSAAEALQEGQEDRAWDGVAQALALYAGPFLAGDEEPAELLVARERLHALQLRHIGRMGQAWSERKRYDRAVVMYERGLDLDDTAEPLCRGLMHCLLARGQVDEALGVYQRCRDALAARLGSEPSRATEQLRSQLASRKQQAQPAPDPPAPAPGAAASGNADPAAAVPHTPTGAAPEPPRRPGMLPPPEKPSIAVLPFSNLGNTPEQGLLCDSLSEDLTTLLARAPTLDVVAGGSALAHKQPAADAREVGQALGVRYVLKGSLQKASARLRIRTQLIDTTTGHHVWADRYDHALADLLTLQDDIARRVLIALLAQLTAGEHALTWARIPVSLESMSLTLEGLEPFNRLTRTSGARARRLFQRAIEADPKNVWALTTLGWTYRNDAVYGWEEDREGALRRARDFAERSRTLDPQFPLTHALLGDLALYTRHYDEALAHLEHALTLSPSAGVVNALLAIALNVVGRPEESIVHSRTAMRVQPRFPPWYLSNLGRSHYLAGRYEDAIQVEREVLTRAPEFIIARVYLVADLVAAGRPAEAREEAAEVLRLRPRFSARGFVKGLPPFRIEAVTELLIDRLRLAGLPE